MDTGPLRWMAGWMAPSWWRARAAKPDQEQWRRLALRVHYDLSKTGRSRSALLVSASADRLAAPAALELAVGFADEVGGPVLLVDAEPQVRAMSAALECTQHHGFTDSLINAGLATSAIVVPTTHPNVWFVPAGLLEEPVGRVSADRIGAVLDNFAGQYEFVLFYGGSVSDNTLALALAPAVSCVLLLVEEGQTTIEDLDAAQAALEIRKVSELAIVVTSRVRAR